MFFKFINKCQKEILRCVPPSSHVWDFYYSLSFFIFDLLLVLISPFKFYFIFYFICCFISYSHYCNHYYFYHYLSHTISWPSWLLVALNLTRNEAWFVPETCCLWWWIGLFSTFQESSIINFRTYYIIYLFIIN